MNATNKLLDKWTAMRSAKLGGPLTQTAIAIEFGLKPSAVSNYKVGLSQAAPHVVEKMAKDLNENPAAWLALVESERAKDAGDRRTWARVARQLGVAAVVTLCAVVTPGKSAPLASSASTVDVRGVPIMSKERRRWWRRSPFGERRAA